MKKRLSLVLIIAAVLALIPAVLAYAAEPQELKPPKNLTAESLGPNTVQLYWEVNDANAVSYKIEYHSQDVSTWTTYKTVTKPSDPDVTVDVTGLTCNVTYYFRVTAIAPSADPKVWSDSKPATAKATPKLEAPEWKTKALVQKKNTSVTLQWYSVTDATGYVIYRDGAKIKTIANDQAESFEDTTVAIGTTYTYTIKAYYKTASAEGEESEERFIQVLPLPPTNLKAKADADGHAVLTWTGSTGAASYNLYRATGSGDYMLLVSGLAGTSTTYTDATGSLGVTYRYVLTTLINGHEGDRSAYAQFTVPMPVPANVQTNSITPNTVDISWNIVPQASMYKVAWSKSNTSPDTWTDTWTTSQISYTVEGLTPCTQYYFAVKAINGSHESAWCTKVWGITLPKAPTDVDASVTAKQYVKVSWSYSGTGFTYDVRRAEGSGAYKIVKTGNTSKSWTDASDLTFGLTYHYQVRSKTTVSNMEVYSQWSDPFDLKLLPYTTTISAVKVKSASSVRVDFDWVENVDGYIIQYRVSGPEGDWSTAAELSNPGQTTTMSMIVDGLTAGETYDFVVKTFITETSGPVYSDQSNIMTARPIPPESASLTVSKDTAHSLLVKWSAIDGVDGYLVYYTDDAAATKPEQMEEAGPVTETQLTLTDLIPGHAYYVHVYGFVINAEGDRVLGRKKGNNTDKYIPTPKAPTNVSATPISTSSIKVTWTESITDEPNQYGYEIAKSDDGTNFTDAYRKVIGSESFIIDDKSLNLGDIRFYKVRAFVFADGKYVYSSYSKAVSAQIVPNCVTAMALSTPTDGGGHPAYTSLKLTFHDDQYDGSTKFVYHIYRSTSKQSAFKKVGEVESTGVNLTYYDKNLECGKTYYYTVVTALKKSGSYLYSKESATVSRKVMPAKPVGLVTVHPNSTSLRYKWTEVKGATGYEVQLTETIGKTPVVGVSKSTSFTFSDLSTGTEYFARARAYRLVNGEKVYGPFTDWTDAELCQPAPVKNLKITDVQYNYATMTWTPLTDVDGYTVRWRVKGGSYQEKLLPGAKTSSYTFEGLETGQTYNFGIRAYKTVGANKNKVYGSWKNASGSYDIQPAKVTGLKLETRGIKGVYLSWNEVEGATEYVIYRADSKSDIDALNSSCVTFTTTATNYLDSTALMGSTYYYRVRALCDTVKGTASASASLLVVPAAPANVKAESVDHHTLKITWDTQSGAASYQVYVSDSASGSFKLLREVTGHSMTHGSLTPGVKKYYKVVSTYVVGGKNYTSAKSATASAKPVPAAPQSLKLTCVKDNTMKVSWHKVDGVDGYRIAYRPKSESKWTLCKTVTKTSGKVPGLTLGTEYSFRVCAYVTVKGEKIFGKDSDTVTKIMTAPGPEEITISMTTPTTAKVTWDAVPDVAGYEISYAYSASKSSAPAASDYTADTTTGTSYTLSNAHTGYYLWVRVRTYSKNGQDKVFSPNYTKANAVMVRPAKPGLSVSGSAGAAATNVKLSWKAITGATGYRIQRSDDNKSTWTNLGAVSGSAATAYNDATADLGVKYYYRIQAYAPKWNDGLTDVYSAFSKAVSIELKPHAPTVTVSGTIDSATLTWSATLGLTSPTAKDSYYEVWRKAGSGNYTKVKTVYNSSAAQFSWTNSGLKTGKTYSYKVKAVIKDRDGKLQDSGFSSSVSFKPVPPQVTGVSATSSAADKIKVMWSAVSGSDISYEVIVRKGGKTGSIVAKKTVKDLSCSFKGLESETKYYVQVRAVKDGVAGKYSKVEDGLVTTLK